MGKTFHWLPSTHPAQGWQWALVFPDLDGAILQLHETEQDARQALIRFRLATSWNLAVVNLAPGE